MSCDNKTAGFGTVGIVIVTLAVLVVVGVLGWRVWDTSQQKNIAPSSNASAAQATTTTNPAQVDPNEGYVVIKEWGVRFKPTAELRNVIYFRPKIVTNDAFSFTTAEMNHKELQCSTSTDMIPFGLLQRGKTTDPTAGDEVATINGYIYQYRSTDAACSKDPVNLSQESKIVGYFIQSVKSLETAK